MAVTARQPVVQRQPPTPFFKAHGFSLAAGVLVSLILFATAVVYWSGSGTASSPAANLPVVPPETVRADAPAVAAVVPKPPAGIPSLEPLSLNLNNDIEQAFNDKQAALVKSGGRQLIQVESTVAEVDPIRVGKDNAIVVMYLETKTGLVTIMARLHGEDGEQILRAKGDLVTIAGEVHRWKIDNCTAFIEGKQVPRKCAKLELKDCRIVN